MSPVRGVHPPRCYSLTVGQFEKTATPGVKVRLGGGPPSPTPYDNDHNNQGWSQHAAVALAPAPASVVVPTRPPSPGLRVQAPNLLRIVTKPQVLG
jgi:hypothetical protein